MTTKASHSDDSKNKKKGLIWTFFFHILVLLLCIFPFFNYNNPPKLSGGITILFGDGDGDYSDFENDGDSDSEAEEGGSSAASETPPPSVNQTSTVSREESPVVATTTQQRQTSNTEGTSETTRSSDTPTQNRQDFGSLFTGGTGGGQQSNTGQSGSPNSSELESITRGSDKVGGGLAGRGVVYEPSISDSSQKTGRVVVNVCVDASGKVVSSKFTQRGSTTTDAYLVDLAERSAAQYTFARGEVERQCGTITMDFRVR
jgi:hypothetical protein